MANRHRKLLFLVALSCATVSARAEAPAPLKGDHAAENKEKPCTEERPEPSVRSAARPVETPDSSDSGKLKTDAVSADCLRLREARRKAIDSFRAAQDLPEAQRNAWLEENARHLPPEQQAWLRNRAAAETAAGTDASHRTREGVSDARARLNGVGSAFGLSTLGDWRDAPASATLDAAYSPPGPRLANTVAPVQPLGGTIPEPRSFNGRTIERAAPPVPDGERRSSGPIDSSLLASAAGWAWWGTKKSANTLLTGIGAVTYEPAAALYQTWLGVGKAVRGKVREYQGDREAGQREVVEGLALGLNVPARLANGVFRPLTQWWDAEAIDQGPTSTYGKGVAIIAGAGMDPGYARGGAVPRTLAADARSPWTLADARLAQAARETDPSRRNDLLLTGTALKTGETVAGLFGVGSALKDAPRLLLGLGVPAAGVATIGQAEHAYARLGAAKPGEERQAVGYQVATDFLQTAIGFGAMARSLYNGAAKGPETPPARPARPRGPPRLYGATIELVQGPDGAWAPRTEAPYEPAPVARPIPGMEDGGGTAWLPALRAPAAKAPPPLLAPRSAPPTAEDPIDTANRFGLGRLPTKEDIKRHEELKQLEDPTLADREWRVGGFLQAQPKYRWEDPPAGAAHPPGFVPGGAEAVPGPPTLRALLIGAERIFDHTPSGGEWFGPQLRDALVAGDHTAARRILGEGNARTLDLSKGVPDDWPGSLSELAGHQPQAAREIEALRIALKGLPDSPALATVRGHMTTGNYGSALDEVTAALDLQSKKVASPEDIARLRRLSALQQEIRRDGGQHAYFNAGEPPDGYGRVVGVPWRGPVERQVDGTCFLHGMCNLPAMAFMRKQADFSQIKRWAGDHTGHDYGPGQGTSAAAQESMFAELGFDLGPRVKPADARQLAALLEQGPGALGHLNFPVSTHADRFALSPDGPREVSHAVAIPSAEMSEKGLKAGVVDSNFTAPRHKTMSELELQNLEVQVPRLLEPALRTMFPNAPAGISTDWLLRRRFQNVLEEHGAGDAELPGRGPERTSAREGGEAAPLRPKSPEGRVTEIERKAERLERLAQEEVTRFLQDALAAKARREGIEAGRSTLTKQELARLADMPSDRYLPPGLARIRADANARRLVERLGSAEVTLNFDPWKRLPDGRTVLEALDQAGVYRNWQETGVSQGRIGSERVAVEDQMFPDLAGRPGADRPVYGALNLSNDPAGAAPKYGEAFYSVKPSVRTRETITVEDSLDARSSPEQLGTFATPFHVLRQLDRSALRQLALGDAGAPVPYTEVQIHGGLGITNVAGRGDVAALNAPARLRGTPEGDALDRHAKTHGIEMRWYAERSVIGGTAR